MLSVPVDFARNSLPSLMILDQPMYEEYESEPLILQNLDSYYEYPEFGLMNLKKDNKPKTTWPSTTTTWPTTTTTIKPSISGTVSFNQPAGTFDLSKINASQFDKDFWKWQNEVRTNPKKFVPILQEFLNNFVDEYVVARPGKPRLRTKEGKRAVQEAINFLNRQPSVSRLAWNNSIALASRDHVLSQGPTGQTGHVSPNGATLTTRMNKYGTSQMMSENIQYSDGDAMWGVLYLIIDDGVADRGHRTNMFRTNWQEVGCYTGPHAKFTQMTVCNFAQGYKAN